MAPSNRNLITAVRASIDARVRGGYAGAMNRIKRGVVRLREHLSILIERHSLFLAHTGRATLLLLIPGC